MEDVKDVYTPPSGSDYTLKPCPFCGCTEVVYMKYDHAAGERWAVACMGCMAEIDPGWAQERHTVQSMWNKRS